MDEGELRALFDDEALEKINGLIANGTLGSTVDKVVKTLVENAFQLPDVQNYIVRGWVKMEKHDDWIIRNLVRGQGPKTARILENVKKDLGLMPESEHKEK